MINKYPQTIIELIRFRNLSSLPNFFINIEIFLSMMITTIYITYDKNLILIYYFIKQIKKTN